MTGKGQSGEVVKAGFEGSREGFVLWTAASYLLNLPRKHSLWYLLFSPACCAIELMQTGGPRTDLDRFGMVFRATPRQSDLMIVGGTVTYKMAERVKLLYDQMAEPKYVIAMGSCANCGGLFQKSYAVLKGIDLILPVDIYIPGCPPRPEALADGMMKVQELIMREDWRRKRRPTFEPAPQAGKGGAISRT
jgi:NADH-quinone oxidoreductase subunit B